MIVYVLLIFATFILSSVSQMVPANSTLVEQPEKRRVSIFHILMLILWCAVCALRGLNVGSDTNGYYYWYNQYFITDISLKELYSTHRDGLFIVLEYFCMHLFNGNWIIFQVVVSLLVYVPVIITVERKSTDVSTSFLLYIFTLNYFSCFNGTRQEIASSLMFFAYYSFLLEKKYFRYFLIMFIAYGFHSSVMFIVPIHLLSTRDFRSIWIKVGSVLLLVGYALFWELWPWVIRVLTFLGQTKMAHDFSQISHDSGSGFLRIIVLLIPLFLGLFYRDYLKGLFTCFNNELVLILFGVLFMLLSTRYWILSRVASYILITQILYIPRLFELLNERSVKLGKVLVIFMYFGYMVVLLLHGDGNYYPYSFIG